MSWTIIITLIVVGMLLVLLEIFILPGLVAGILGGVAIIAGIYQAYKTFGAEYGHITAGATVIAMVLLLVLLFRSNTWTKAALSDTISGKVNDSGELNLKSGDEGTTITRLYPTGKAEISAAVYEVQSISGIIEANEDIVVTRIEGYKIFVKPKNA